MPAIADNPAMYQAKPRWSQEPVKDELERRALFPERDLFIADDPHQGLAARMIEDRPLLEIGIVKGAEIAFAGEVQAFRVAAIGMRQIPGWRLRERRMRTAQERDRQVFSGTTLEETACQASAQCGAVRNNGKGEGSEAATECRNRIAGGSGLGMANEIKQRLA